jgi:hypothetical protein
MSRRLVLFGFGSAVALGLGTFLLRGPAGRDSGGPPAARVQANLHALAEATAGRLAAALDHQWRLHAALASALQPLGPGADAQDMRARLDAAKGDHSHLTWMGVAEAASGRVLASTGGVLGDADVSSRPWFAEGQRADYAGDVHDAVLLQRALRRDERDEPLRLIDFATPLRDAEGRVVAVLGAHLDWQWIRTLLRQTTLPVGVQLVLLARTGAVIFGPAAAFPADLDGLPRAGVTQMSGAPSFGWSVAALRMDAPS